MNETYVKELLNTLRLNKTIFWNSLFITLGGVLGLLFKAVHTKNNIIEIIFVLFGGILAIIIVYLIGLLDNNIRKLLQQLKGETKK